MIVFNSIYCFIYADDKFKAICELEWRNFYLIWVIDDRAGCRDECGSELLYSQLEYLLVY